MPGSRALYRLAKFNGVTGDLVHKYTTSTSEYSSLLTQGWTFDHIAGYLQTTSIGPTNVINGYPYISGGHYMSRRCGTNTACQGEAGVRDYYTGYYSVTSTPKPAGATRQTMEFDLWTPDYFSPGQDEHIAIGLHGELSLDFSNIAASTGHYALGLMLGQTNCYRSRSVGVEAFWPTGNNTVACPSGSTGLNNNTTYHFSITVTDGGTISYTVTPQGSSTPVIQETVDGNALFTNSVYRFPTSRTGYFFVPATLGSADYTLYFTNLSVYWQP